jgi:hypothetical protein
MATANRHQLLGEEFADLLGEPAKKTAEAPSIGMRCAMR